MNFNGATPFPIKRFNGQVDWDDPTQIPNGCGVVCKNSRFFAESVATRFGLRHALQYSPSSGDVTGLEVLDVEGTQGVDLGIVYTSDGKLLFENPAGSGTLVPAVTPSVLPSGEVVMQVSQAYQRAYLAFSDLQKPSAPPLMVDGATAKVYPATQNPIGMTWTPGTYAVVGDLVRSTTSNLWFRCTVPGVMGPGEPTWPGQANYFTPTLILHSATVQDPNGTSQWEEWTPGIASYLPAPDTTGATLFVSNAGTIPSGQDVYIKLAYNNKPTGESPNRSAPLSVGPTVTNTSIRIYFDPQLDNRGPQMPQWVAHFAPGGTISFGKPNPPNLQINVYIAAVATGSNPPAAGAYGFYGSFPVDSPINITSLTTTTFTQPSVPMPGSISGQVFYGSSGKRFAILTREAVDGTLAPVDLNSPIQFFAQGQGAINVTAVSRTNTGNYFFYLEDVSTLAVGGTITVSNIVYASGANAGTEDTTFEGTFTISVIGILPNAPAGVVQCNVGGTPTAVLYSEVTGTVAIPAGPAPIAVFPTDASNHINHIFGLTVAGQSNAGPYFFIPENDPTTVFSTYILNLDRTGTGSCFATVGDGSGFSPGQLIQTTGMPLADLNTVQLLASVNGNNVVFPFPGSNEVFGAVGPNPATMSVVQQLATIGPSGLTFGTSNGALTLNFTDDFLTGSEDITYLLTAMAIPPAVDLYFVPSLRKLAVAGATGFETGFLFTYTDTIGIIDGATGFLAVESSNGGKAVCVREMPDQMIVGFKTTGGYRIVPSADVPQNWGLSRLWDEHGPPDPRCVGIGPNWLVFGCKEGFYRYDGQPLECVSREIAKSWKRINWLASQPMWIVVDDEEKVVHVGVATDGADTPNERWTLNYFMGWEPPIRETLTGDMMVARNARRWSVGDQIAARCAVIAKRTMTYDPNHGSAPDPRIATRQILMGRSQMIANLSQISVAQTVLVGVDSSLQIQGTAYVRIAKVVNGTEVSATSTFGPFQVVQSIPTRDNPVPELLTFQVNLPGNDSTISWNIYYGTSPSSLTFKVNVSGTTTVWDYDVDGTQVPAFQGVGTAYVDMPYPDVYDDNGAGIDWQYQPAFATVMGRILRYRGVSGQIQGGGVAVLTPVSDNPLGLPSPGVSLGTNQDVIHFARGIILDREHLSYNVNNGAMPGSWGMLQALTIWFVPLFLARRFQ